MIFPPIAAPDMSGHFTMTIRRSDGSVKRELDFDNLILNTGLNQIGFGGVGPWVAVGSGSTAPVIANTGLQAQVAVTANIRTSDSGSISITPYYGYTRRTWRFNPGEAVGNLSEVGVGWSEGFFSRALILDSEGAPTTITVLSDEVLDVTYELRLYPPLTDSTFNVTIAGVVHACRRRASNVGQPMWAPHYLFDIGSEDAFHNYAYSGDIGTMFEQPSGGSGAPSERVLLPYSNNSKLRQSVNSFGLDNGNVDPAGIKSIWMFQNYNSLGVYQISFTPPILKDNTKILTLTTQVSWDRHTPA